ncbi:RNA polymerase sigma factor [Bacteroidia bacterium]|nr:RNA polymerase sigma factor [Bacteroidia bacterium]GHU55750.1 RNA polymerase sigma factor [Bacteroidia bacterium]
MEALQFQKNLLGMQENMMNFALMLTSNHDDAQDLMQDTTLKILDNQDRFMDNLNFAGWVFTVMHHVFINNYRKIVQGQMIINQQADLYNIEVEDTEGTFSPDARYRMIEMTQAIKKLSKNMKVPFSMYMSGYKYSEISERLNLPLGTVKSRIFFARQELQKELEESLLLDN